MALQIMLLRGNAFIRLTLPSGLSLNAGQFITDTLAAFSKVIHTQLQDRATAQSYSTESYSTESYSKEVQYRARVQS